jgi:hypothetical protein
MLVVVAVVNARALLRLGVHLLAVLAVLAIMLEAMPRPTGVPVVVGPVTHLIAPIGLAVTVPLVL